MASRRHDRLRRLPRRDGRRARGRRAEGACACVEFPARRGKAAVLNDLVRDSGADILVFTDANTRFEPGAVRRPGPGLRRSRRRRRVRPARLRDGAGARATPEPAYWDRETRLKEAEGTLGVCLGRQRRDLRGAPGSRPAAARGHDVDGRLPRSRCGWRGQGRRVVFAGEAVAREDAARDVAARGLAAVPHRHRRGTGPAPRALALAAARHPLLTLAFLSRKAARWLAPVVALAAAVAALFSPALRPAGSCGSRGGGAPARRRPAAAAPAGRGREALLFRRAQRRSRARRGGGIRRLRPSGLDADGAILMAPRRPSSFRAVALAGDLAIAVGVLYFAFFLRTRVAIPGTLQPAAGRQRALHLLEHRDRGGGAGDLAVVLRPLPGPRALPRAARTAAPAGSLRRAPDARLGLLSGAAVLVSALGPGDLPRRATAALRGSGGRRSTASFRSPDAARSSWGAGPRRPSSPTRFAATPGPASSCGARRRRRRRAVGSPRARLGRGSDRDRRGARGGRGHPDARGVLVARRRSPSACPRTGARTCSSGRRRSRR